MAGRTGNGALTRALQVYIILVCDAEDIVSFVRFYGFNKMAFGIFKVDFDSGR